MPNNCMVTLSVGGRTECVNKFIEILGNDYDKVHMYRILESYPTFINTYGMYSHAQIFCDVAWSVACTMLPGPLSYYDIDFEMHKNNKVDSYYDWKNHTSFTEVCTMYNFKGTNLLELAKVLGLTIQVYSTECGLEFLEDIKILPNGKKIRDYCGNYTEWWIGDYNTYQELLEDFNLKPSDLPFDEEQFNVLKSNNQDVWKYAEVEFNDEIPDQPKYMAKNIMYKLRKDINNNDSK